MDFVGDAVSIFRTRPEVSGGVSIKTSCGSGVPPPPPPHPTNPKARAEQQSIFVTGCIVITPSNRCRRSACCKIGSSSMRQQPLSMQNCHFCRISRLWIRTLAGYLPFRIHTFLHRCEVPQGTVNHHLIIYVTIVGLNVRHTCPRNRGNIRNRHTTLHSHRYSKVTK